MSGQIFISYRREDSWALAGRISDRLRGKFGQDKIFMDLDSIELGGNFIEVIETTVAKCDVLLAIIGNNWLTAKDENQDRRLDNPADWVRKEIGTALQRQIRVIPILVGVALMPTTDDLPEDLKPLSSLNAMRLTSDSFEGDLLRLADTIKPVLEKAAAEKGEQEQPQTETPKTKTSTQTWIRQIDKLSWLPFAGVVLIRVYFLFIFPLNALALQRFSIWLALLIFGILPSIVIASSFLKYPRRRRLEASISIACIVGVLIEYWGIVSVNTLTVMMIFLLFMGAAIKIWLLLDSRTNKTGLIAKAT